MTKIRAVRHGTKKDTIIQKASALFRLKGFNATSMRELADSMGVEAPSLYNHIGSKSEILQAICFSIAEQFTSQLEKTEQESVTGFLRIETVIRFHIRMMLEHYDEVFVANHEWKHLKEPYLGNFLNQRRQYEKRLATWIETGIRKKEFRVLNPYVAVLTVLSALRGLEFWLRHKRNISAVELENDMVDLLLHGLIK